MNDWADRIFDMWHLEDSATDNDEIVITVQGKNHAGTPIYNYLLLSMEAFREMRMAFEEGRRLSPSDYGTVIAAGFGDVPNELHAEMSGRLYNVQMPPLRPRRS